MKKHIIYILGAISISIQAQNSFDALRMNSYENLGTARSMGMAGSFGALGVDPQALQINPANGSNFNSGFLSITPYLGIMTSVGGNYGYINSKANFNVSDLSMLFKPNDNSSIFFSMNHQSDYHSELTNSYNGSLINQWTYNANQYGITDPSDIYSALPFSSALAYDTYLLNYDLDNNVFTPEVDEQFNQQRVLNSRGHKKNFTFGFSQKFSDAFKFGISANLNKYRYINNISYTEYGNNQANDFNRFNLYEDKRSVATGLNIKAGISSKLGELLRLSGAIQTPTVNWVSDEWSADLSSYFASGEYQSEQRGSFNYYYISPAKVDLGLGLVLLKKWVINMDYSYLNHNNSLFISRSSSYDLGYINDEINQELTAAHQVRVGSEVRLGNTYFRGGAGYETSAFSNQTVNDEKVFWGLGMGFNFENQRFDIGLINLKRSESIYDYLPFAENREIKNINETKIAATWTIKL